jgi:hypothetical protein
MRRTLYVGVLLLLTSLCAPGSAASLTFAEAPGSPYSTTDKTFVSTGSGVLGGAVAGDFNGDGVEDLAVVNATGLPAFNGGESVTVLLGHRDGGLTMAPSSPVELYSGGVFASYGAIAAGDFTGEDKLDLAVVDNVHDTVSILLGDGAGGFRLSGSPIPFSGAEPNAIAVGDFTGNGVEDLAFASGGDVNVLLGNGTGGFAPASGSPFAVDGYATSVAAGDFDSSGRSDLAVTSSADQVGIYRARTDGRFEEVSGSPLATGENPAALVAADLTGNGITDLATVNTRSGDVTVLLGDGAGGFAPAAGSPFALPTGAHGLPESIAASAFNGSGDMDLAVANFNGSSDNIAILRGNGRGGFTSAAGSPFPANGNPRSLVVGDFNGDGRPDLAVVNPFQGVVTVLENTSNGEPEPEEVEEPVKEPAEKAREADEPVELKKAQAPIELPIVAELRAQMARQMALTGNLARLGSVAKDASFAYAFQAPEAGAAVVEWYALPLARGRADAAAHAKPVLMASGRLAFTAAATRMMKMEFTRAGRHLWREADGLALRVKQTFTPVGAKPILLTRTVSLRR